MRRFLPLFMTLILCFSACSRNRISKSMPVEEKMRIGNEYFAAEKYHKAIPYFTEVVLDRKAAFTAEAQMKLAECYFYQNKFMSARFEYEELIRLFKKYPQINEAYFKIGVCYYQESLSPHYTQEETILAMNAFQTFIEKFPLDDKKLEAYDYIQKCQYKLLEKTFYNGYAYYKLFDYSSALMYFDEITSQQLMDELDKKALYYSARIYLTRKDEENIEKVLTKMKNRYPESEETIEIKARAEKLE
ncbi:MAG: outer membrane protein assembly factor BamD [Candidatus Cloacimonetes bacterium]|nr:outer membrane protein assembly factor BamD [Candidatus Cloacimonadota bacterium]